MLLALAVVPNFFRELLSNQDPPEVKFLLGLIDPTALVDGQKEKVGAYDRWPIINLDNKKDWCRTDTKLYTCQWGILTDLNVRTTQRM